MRDLADAHVLALEKEAAANNRIIVASGPYKWQDWGMSSSSSILYNNPTYLSQ